MPWSEKNYPDSMKNLSPLIRRKAIDIANAMLSEGYQEGDAIPIAISQARKWAEDASAAEQKELKAKDITNHPTKKKSRGAKLIERDVEVIRKEDGYHVKTIGALRPDSKHETKSEAVERAEEIAQKRGTKVKDGSK